MAKCKITVLKCLFDAELKAEYVDDPNYGPCPFFKVGDTFVTGGEKPEEFKCKIGWKSIKDEVQGCTMDDRPFFGDKPQVVCCNDGIRPVLFRIETVKE